MKAVGNLAKLIEANREHAARVAEALALDEPDICLECGRPNG